MRSVIVLGSTGSVGTQALDVARRNPDRFRVVGLSAGSNHELLIGQIREFLPPYVAIADENVAEDLRERLAGLRDIEVLSGPDSAERLARDVDADMVLNALVGSAGLAPTLTALQTGKALALANKESLVVGGELVKDLIKGEPERLVPVDSEHAALALCLRGERRDDLKRVILTGSGGPFRGWTHAELARASVKEALAHPVWQMGPKITIDSATLMNKGLEVIEAHYLFDLEYSQIHAVIHPEGIVHALAEFRDGSMTAQLAMPDMRLPIQYALSYPERLPSPARQLPPEDWEPIEFSPLDPARYPAYATVRAAAEAGGNRGVILNAADEAAVAAFLGGKLAFDGIAGVIGSAVERWGSDKEPSLPEIVALDVEVREALHADLGMANA
jgi:1-deoxy-D-xylulose-5-phosphate reductoisomerase